MTLGVASQRAPVRDASPTLMPLSMNCLRSMTDTEPVLCPECGWTGTVDDLALDDGTRQCPVCAEAIEFIE